MASSERVCPCGNELSPFARAKTTMCADCRKGKTPRAPTIEAKHIIRGVDFKRSKTRSVEELQKLDEENRAGIAEEARARWTEYHRLGQESLQAITNEYSDEEFFAYDKANWGLQWCGNIGINSERTEGGIGIEVAPGETGENL